MKVSYLHSESVHNLKAPREVVPIIASIKKPSSVLDVGCGTGTWLKVFQELYNLQNILGLDGSYVDRSQLVISEEFFKPLDLRKPFDLGRKFDLLLSLEVAEHLPEEAADDYVESLCKHSDTIIFSAAIPHQGGQNHINEQWPDYWMKKFERHGYHFHDVIRPLIWNNDKIDWWYRQNIFLVNKEEAAIRSSTSLVHPELFHQVNQNFKDYKKKINAGEFGIKNALKILFYSALRYIKRR